MRGARYGLPGWVVEEQRKNGSTKTVYLDRADAERKAREFVGSAKTAAEVAGRQVVLLAMARYTDEQAIAQSQRSFYALSPGRQLPFSDEVIDPAGRAVCRETLGARAGARPRVARTPSRRARQAARGRDLARAAVRLTRERYLRSTESKPLKFEPSLCDHCNNTRSQPHDYAYDPVHRVGSQA